LPVRDLTSPFVPSQLFEDRVFGTGDLEFHQSVPNALLGTRQFAGVEGIFRQWKYVDLETAFKMDCIEGAAEAKSGADSVRIGIEVGAQLRSERIDLLLLQVGDQIDVLGIARQSVDGTRH